MSYALRMSQREKLINFFQIALILLFSSRSALAMPRELQHDDVVEPCVFGDEKTIYKFKPNCQGQSLAYGRKLYSLLMR